MAPRSSINILLLAVAVCSLMQQGSAVLGARAGSSELIFNFTTSGLFSISLGEEKDVWMESAGLGVRVNGTFLGTDELTSNTTYAGAGTDVLGAYQSLAINWTRKHSDDHVVVFSTVFKVYDVLQAVVFEQHFPVDLNSAGGAESSDLVSIFPSFTPSDKAVTDLNYITYEGTFPSLHLGRYSNKMNFPGGAHGGVPLVLHDKSLRALVISPLQNFMVGQQAVVKNFGDRAVSCGINGKVESIPAGYVHSTIMMAGEGIQETMYEWGSALLKYHGKTRTTPDSDFSVKYLGWWTDNGGYYHYQTEQGKNYQQTMLDAKAKLQQLKIPFRYFQLDSWWYFKEGTRGAVTLWEPMPDVFPGGMSDWLGQPLSLHNRYFAAKNNYSASWFLVKEGEDCALPNTTDLYDYIMSKAVKWGPGMFQYEQDWLVTTYDRCSYAQTDLFAARDWLTTMAKSAASLNVTIQYCMALPNHMLQSVELQAVTVSRATGDYSASSNQWAVGKTSLLYHSIGIIPFKDCFQTVSVNESGCPHHPHCQETNPALQALASTMSMGPIAPADGIQFMNDDTVALLKRTCSWSNGLLFKPDVPAIVMDAVFQTVFSDQDPTPFELWHTYSDFSGGRFHYIIAANLDEDFELTTEHIGAPTNSHFIAYNYFESCNMTAESCTFKNLQPFNSSASLKIHVPKDKGMVTPSGVKLALNPFKYYVLAPVLPNGWTFLGEGMKFAVASKQRFTAIAGDTGKNLEVSLTGSEGEGVSVAAVTPAGQVVAVEGTFGKSSTATVTCGPDIHCAFSSQ